MVESLSSRLLKAFFRQTWANCPSYNANNNFSRQAIWANDDDDDERRLILALRSVSWRIHYRWKSYRHCRKSTVSGSARPVDGLKALVYSRPILLATPLSFPLSRAIRHSRWLEPKSAPPIRRHLSADAKNQFAHVRYSSEITEWIFGSELSREMRH